MEFWLPGVTKLKKVMAGVKLTWSLGRWSNNKHTHMFHNMAYIWEFVESQQHSSVSSLCPFTFADRLRVHTGTTCFVIVTLIIFFIQIQLPGMISLWPDIAEMSHDICHITQAVAVVCRVICILEILWYFVI